MCLFFRKGRKKRYDKNVKCIELLASEWNLLIECWIALENIWTWNSQIKNLTTEQLATAAGHCECAIMGIHFKWTCNMRYHHFAICIWSIWYVFKVSVHWINKQYMYSGNFKLLHSTSKSLPITMISRLHVHQMELIIHRLLRLSTQPKYYKYYASCVCGAISIAVINF